MGGAVWAVSGFVLGGEGVEFGGVERVVVSACEEKEEVPIICDHISQTSGVLKTSG